MNFCNRLVRNHYPFTPETAPFNLERVPVTGVFTANTPALDRERNIVPGIIDKPELFPSWLFIELVVCAYHFGIMPVVDIAGGCSLHWIVGVRIGKSDSVNDSNISKRTLELFQFQLEMFFPCRVGDIVEGQPDNLAGFYWAYLRTVAVIYRVRPTG